MSWIEKFANFDLLTGLDNGTSEANAWKTITSLNAGLLPGERVNIKRQAVPYQVTGSGVQTLSFLPATAATMGNPIGYRGYESTIGDGGYWVVHVDANAGSVQFNQSYSILENIEMTINKATVAGTNNFRSATIGSFLINLRLEFGGGVSTVGNSIGCYFEHYGQTANPWGGNVITVNGVNQASSIWHRCFAKRMPSSHYNWAGHTPRFISVDSYDHLGVFDNCIFVGNDVEQESGIYYSRNDHARAPVVTNSLFYNFKNGVVLEGNEINSRHVIQITNNIFSIMSGYAVQRYNDTNPWGNIMIRKNAYHNCTSGFTNYDNKFSNDNIALSASPYTDPLLDDFTLNDVVGGGALLKAHNIHVDPLDAASMVTRSYAQYSSASTAYFG